MYTYHRDSYVSSTIRDKNNYVVASCTNYHDSNCSLVDENHIITIANDDSFNGSVDECKAYVYNLLSRIADGTYAGHKLVTRQYPWSYPSTL